MSRGGNAFPRVAGSLFLIWMLLAGMPVTGDGLPVEKRGEGSPEPLAAWSLLQGAKLAAQGQCVEALLAGNAAYGQSRSSTIKRRALALRVQLLATCMDAPEAAKERHAQLKALLPDGDPDLEPPAPLPALKIPLSAPSTVRVLLTDWYRSMRIEGLGLRADQGGQSVWSGRRVILASRGDRLRMSGGGSGQWSGRLILRAEEPMRVILGRSRPMRLRGVLYITAHQGRLRVINHLSAEAYLRGVVGAQSAPGWPLESLKAQAVASRSYLYHQLRHRQPHDYDLNAADPSQHYFGINRESRPSDRAVKETNGQVLVTDKGKGDGVRPILALYAVNSGGHTAEAEALLGVEKSYLKAQPDSPSKSGRRARWSRTVSRRLLERVLASAGVADMAVGSMEPDRLGPSGRILSVKIRHAGGVLPVTLRPLLVKGLKLPDAPLSIKSYGGGFLLEGGGLGLGLGLMQEGAARMGRDGRSYRDILGFYYPGAPLVHLFKGSVADAVQAHPSL
ncbi:MAG: SpoIID/LytB domain-containing protein [Magnetococcales bacterium]|nr:SpoIID/LytB domain-containing protein [Magnetococcales bacterium]